MKIAMKKFLLPITLLLAACGTNDAPAEKEAGTQPDAVAMQERIRSMEDSLAGHIAVDLRSAHTLIDVYKAYAEAHPLSHEAPEYLFKAAGIHRTIRKPQESVLLYDRIIQDYPSWERLPDAYYVKALTIDADIGHKGEAKRAYQQVINQFPDHPYAQDARALIANLEYSDEELIRRFQQMEKEGVDPEAAR